MRTALLPALLLSFSAHAQDATPARAPDPQVRQQLEALEYEYEVDEDGDYRMVFEMADSTEKRSQLVYVRTPVETYGVLRIREVWSPGYKAAGTEFPAGVANRLLAASQDNKVGAWAKQDEYAVFVVKLPADADAKALDDAIDAAITTADAMEAELTPGKDDL
jgi:hypothetical protein